MLKWLNPKDILPKDGELIWVILEPHKWHGTFKESIASIQIVCGWVEVSHTGNMRVQNYDELGYGSISWDIATNKKDGVYSNGDAKVLGWMAAESMLLPDWYKGY